MKRFKELFNEFRNPFRDSGEFDRHARRQVIEFMKRTPINYTTREGHELHFHNSHDAAHTIAEAASLHYAGLEHNIANTGNRQMTDYFTQSSATHDRLMDVLQQHIENHPDLPEHLKPYVGHVVDEIDEQHMGKDPKVSGEYANSVHKPPANAKGYHPSRFDVAHHLKDVISTIEENPNQGYFLRREEKR